MYTSDFVLRKGVKKIVQGTPTPLIWTKSKRTAFFIVSPSLILSAIQNRIYCRCLTNESKAVSSLYQMMCGTDPYPKDYKAKKYKLEKHSLRKEDFVHLMKSLPVHVEEEDIEEMFAFADKNQDGHLSYSEFQVMVNPPPPPKVPKPHIADIGLPPQVSDFFLCIIRIN